MRPVETPARWFGVYPAKVHDVQDPDKQGRVQVDLAMTPEGGEERFRVWARISTMMAGPGRGSWFIPDPGDEVLISFLGGDPRQPFVIGSLWNGKDAPPQTMDAKNNVRVLKTRSGHKLELDDTDGAAKITLTTKSGCELVLDDAGAGTVTLSHPSGSSIEFDGTGNISITAVAKLSIGALEVDVQAPYSNFNGVTNHQTMITPAVVGATYTPGAGNIW
jgi:uncharacterized protein involved in type VI secretion and phage assembly